MKPSKSSSVLMPSRSFMCFVIIIFSVIPRRLSRKLYTQFISFSLSFDRIYSTHDILVHSNQQYHLSQIRMYRIDDSANRMREKEENRALQPKIKRTNKQQEWQKAYSLSLTSTTVGLIWIRIVLLDFWCRVLLLQRRNNAWNFYWIARGKREKKELELKNIIEAVIVDNVAVVGW